jgi:PPOX class probable F420-dependent enzyme
MVQAGAPRGGEKALVFPNAETINVIDQNGDLDLQNRPVKANVARLQRPTRPHQSGVRTPRAGTLTTGPRIPDVTWSDQGDREMHDPIVLRQRFAESRVARLATLDADGRPHLVPIVFALAGDILYSAVDAKPKRSATLRRIENARKRPDVTVLVDHYEEQWSRLWWIRLRGRARVLDEGEEAVRALALLADKYEQYRREPPGLPVLAIDITEWRSWTH